MGTEDRPEEFATDDRASGEAGSEMNQAANDEVEAGAGAAEGEQASEVNQTAAERLVGVAREQATQAADAFRRGEFMRDPIVDEDSSSDDRLIAMLCYVSQIIFPVIMPVIVLISESSKRHPFQRYHAVQSLALMALLLGLGAVTFVGTSILAALPIIGGLFSVFGFVLCCLTPLIFVMVVMALGFYGYQAYQGKRFAIPGLTSFLKDQGWI